MGLYHGTKDSDYVPGGSAGADTMYGYGGSDALYGNGGNDRLYGGDDTDWLGGGSGDDILWGQNGRDYLMGDAGNDTLFGGEGDDILVGSLGNDDYYGGVGYDNLTFTKLAGTAPIKVDLALRSYEIGTTYSGRVQDVESVELRDGHDLALGDNQMNFFYGFGGNDTLNGRGGYDYLYGGDGNDVLEGGTGSDDLFGGAGIDTAVFKTSNNMLVDLSNKRAVGEGTDFLTEIENVRTGAGNDTVVGTAGSNQISTEAGNDLLRSGAGSDTIWAGAGNDTLVGGWGADRMIGGAGDDIYHVDNGGDVVVETANGGTDRIYTSISIDLNGRNGAFLNVEWLVLSGTEHLSGFGNDANNVLLGNAGNNVLSGRGGNDHLSSGAGNDTIRGGVGDDRLLGGTGNDDMTGGAGADTFQFKADFDRDIIRDFQNNVDTIHLIDVGVNSFAQARSFATQRGDDVVFNFGGGDVLTVENITINALADDMIFG